MPKNNGKSKKEKKKARKSKKANVGIYAFGRGRIRFIGKATSIGSEQTGERSAIIVSSDEQNRSSTEVEVVFLTTKKKRLMPTHVRIDSALDLSIALCEQIQSEGILPFYFGFKDTWTCLAPWNAIAVDLAPADVCKQVNSGSTNFTDEYREVAEKMLQLLDYGEEGPFAYDYNSACTAFANGESAMYTIGSYAVPQIKSVNPDMDIDSFVMPASSDKDGNTLNSGVDLQFCVTEASPNKEAAYEVIDFLLDDENLQAYLDDQNAVPCKSGEFTLAPNLDGMKDYIASGNMTDYQDHYYPSEMAVDAQIQTLLIEKDVDAFLAKFDKDWARYNRDIIRMVQEYEAQH